MTNLESFHLKLYKDVNIADFVYYRKTRMMITLYHEKENFSLHEILSDESNDLSSIFFQ